MRWGCQAGMCEKDIPCSGVGILTSSGHQLARDSPSTHPFVDPVITATFSARAPLQISLLSLIFAERGAKEQQRPLNNEALSIVVTIWPFSSWTQSWGRTWEDNHIMNHVKICVSTHNPWEGSTEVSDRCPTML